VFVSPDGNHRCVSGCQGRYSALITRRAARESADRLVDVEGQLKIAERTVVLDKVRLAAENLNVFL